MNAVILNHIKKSYSNSNNLEVMFEDLCKNTIPRDNKTDSIRASLEECVTTCSPLSIDINDG